MNLTGAPSLCPFYDFSVPFPRLDSFYRNKKKIDSESVPRKRTGKSKREREVEQRDQDPDSVVTPLPRPTRRSLPSPSYPSRRQSRRCPGRRPLYRLSPSFRPYLDPRSVGSRRGWGRDPESPPRPWEGWTEGRPLSSPCVLRSMGSSLRDGTTGLTI